MVSERSLAVLRAIVLDYVSSSEPVGSKGIVDRHAFGVSAATIRNDMALLEEEELIAAPHTSSGRVPTDKGYRLFVDQLADLRPLSPAQRHAIEAFLGQAVDFDDVLGRTVRLLAQLTNQAALVQYPSFGTARVRHVELVPLGPQRLMTVLITDTGRVDQHLLDTAEPVDAEQLQALRARLNEAIDGRALGDAGPLLAALPDSLPPEAQALGRAVVEAVAEQVQANRQDRLVMAGTANLARTERDFGGSIYPVLEAIEEQVTLLRLFGEMELDGLELSTSIGRENAGSALEQASIVSGRYSASGGGSARIGVVGPMRMDYSNNIAAVRAVARYLSRLLGED
ncbi:heat-inducible transcriptional repressor HrcA [Homoserinibacter sp. YIM 151385]|uniref:heat-inducible transcriptional repressor HrcA n=1 Tax=Homoserinibacter sp. YIM 151385 TaxID=2985506 RepID=UPI0022F0B0DB|nr:heat-inducible transcriptional repressor HrcA [Homoserinibacter sp. YIM 151385]WBU38932.1 heat-inducible transcriptional repressor HrcA [Homoserinibacter sp. YIM 151385]